MEFIFVLSILIWIGIYLIVGLSLNIEFGYGGIPQFGRNLAVLMGAIAVGGIMNRLLMAYFGVSGNIATASGEVKGILNDMIAQNPWVGLGIFLLAIALALVLGAAVGAISILPSARLSELYLALTLLAISEVAWIASNNHPDIVGGYYGVSTPNVLKFVPGEYNILGYAILISIVAVIIYYMVNRMLQSPYGRLLKAMRENEDVVSAYGKDIMKIRIKTVALGSAIAAVGGVLLSLQLSTIMGKSFNKIEWTFFPIFMILLGGRGNTKGVVAGVSIFVIIRFMLETYKYDVFGWLPVGLQWVEYMIFGLLLIMILIYRHEGLIKEKPILNPSIKRVSERRGRGEKRSTKNE
ncbi:MAG: branched-chain amino acid ABC transporter permease [Candidatus Hadarchaeota archaeon]